MLWLSQPRAQVCECVGSDEFLERDRLAWGVGPGLAFGSEADDIVGQHRMDFGARS